MGITRSVSVKKGSNVNDTQSQSAIGVSVIQTAVYVGVRTAGEWCVIHVSVFPGPPQSDLFPFVTSRRLMSQWQFGWCN